MKHCSRLVVAGVGLALSAAAVPAATPPAPDQFDLKTAIAFALESNFAIRQARERIRQQEGVVTTVAAAGLPNVSVVGNYQRSDIATVQTPPGGTFIFVPEGASWRMTLTGTQNLFAGGGIRAAIRNANLNHDAAILELQALINDALLDVRTRFYDVLLAREQIKVEEQNLGLLESQLRDTTLRAQAGTTPEFERLRAEVAVANAKTPLISARNAYRLAIEELRRVLGLIRNDTESMRKDPDFGGALDFQPRRFELQTALDAAQANRPELKRLAKLVAAGDEGVAVAHARYFPTLFLSGGGESRQGATNSFRDSLDGLRASAQSRWEVTGRATSGAVTQAISQAEQLRLLESETKLAVEVEVRRAFFALEQAGELAVALEKTVEQAEEAVRLAAARFQADVTPQLDLLKAQVELTSARTNRLRANHGYNVAIAQLRRATGLPAVEYASTIAPTQPTRAP